ncbi:Hypothetical protein, putative [Bodo saltans]|uniref:RanBP2-type domain-containing protein n=1 Tax=Bodo saltans TaxID=75058 RepID=A0A0S4IWB0_BODSA|nr:Hypothetical protein, putative [Bodo saltans]|eukprot:CUF97338.1 Hypothetical protein, putative [Bodo saltans]
MSRHRLPSTLLPAVQRATATALGVAAPTSSSLPCVTTSVRVFARKSQLTGQTRIHRHHVDGAAALDAYLSEHNFPNDGAPDDQMASSHDTSQLDRDTPPVVLSSSTSLNDDGDLSSTTTASASGMYLVSLMASLVTNEVPHHSSAERTQLLQHLDTCFHHWYTDSRKELRRDIISSSSRDEPLFHSWLQARISVLASTLSLQLFPLLTSTKSPDAKQRKVDANEDEDKDIQQCLHFLRSATRSSKYDIVGKRAFQFALTQIVTCAPNMRRLEKCVHAWLSSTVDKGNATREEDFWCVVLSAVNTLGATSVPTPYLKDWLNLASRSMSTIDDALRGSQAQEDDLVSFPSSSADITTISQPCQHQQHVETNALFSQLWRHATEVLPRMAILEHRQRFVETILAARSHLSSSAAGTDTHQSTHPQDDNALAAALDSELRWIHKSIRSLSTNHHNSSSGNGGGQHDQQSRTTSLLTPILDVWSAMHAQYRKRVSSLSGIALPLAATITTEEGAVTTSPESTGAPDNDTVCDMLALYLNGTVLLNIGHRLDQARDWSLDLHKRVASLVEETVTTLSSSREFLTDIHHGTTESSPYAKWKVSILTRAHEGLRLSMKSFVRARCFTDATAVFERYPHMGPSWELTKCYSESRRTDDALRVGSLFLQTTFHIFSAALKSDDGRTAAGGSKGTKVLPPHITKALLESVEARGSDLSAKERISTSDVSTTVPIEVVAKNSDAASSIREGFLSTLRAHPLPGVPHVQVWERFFRGCVKGLISRSSIEPPSQLQSLWWIPIQASLEHARHVLMNGGPVSHDIATCGLSRDTLACICYAAHQHMGGVAAQLGSTSSMELIISAFQKLDEAFPRLGVWGVVLTWFLTRSGNPITALHLLQALLPTPPNEGECRQQQRAPNTIVLAALDTMSPAALQYLHEVVAAASSSTATTEIADLIALSSSQQIALERETSADARDGWVCVYCHAHVSSARKSCHVCSTLKLHLWRCRSCNGFSPSTHSSDCLVCGALRPSESLSDEGSTTTTTKTLTQRRAEVVSDNSDVIPLRDWTCKLCRTKNNATHPFHCSSCKEPSRLAFQLRASIAPFDCRSCGTKQQLGMIRPWCDECGTLHPAAAVMAATPSTSSQVDDRRGEIEDDSCSQHHHQQQQPHRASVWSCSECAQWNPWVSFHCIDCDAPRPVAQSQIREVVWQTWSCEHCDGSNVMWKTFCSHCQATRSDEGRTAQLDDHNTYSSDAILSVVDPQLAMNPVVASTRNGASRCTHCGCASLVDERDGACHSCGLSAHPGPVLWVCLRSGCLYMNLLDQSNPVEPPRCAKCHTLKGLTTTLARHTNIFRYKEPHAAEDTENATPQDDAPPIASIPLAADVESDETVESVLQRHHQPAVPTAVDVWAMQCGPYVCHSCSEPLASWNLLRLCPACSHSCWSPHSPSGDAASTDELVLWLHLAAAEALVVAARARNSQRALVLLKVCVGAFQQARETQLPWRGRDLSNMRCTESSRNPIHEPDGAPHSAITRTSAVIRAALSYGGEGRDATPARQRQWLGLAVELVAMVNETTDMDELTFEVVGQLAQAIHQLGDDDGVAMHRNSNDEKSFLDTLRLEYLLSMKLPVGCIVGEDRCRRCLYLRCRCGGRGGAKNLAASISRGATYPREPRIAQVSTYDGTVTPIIAVQNQHVDRTVNQYNSKQKALPGANL